MFPESEISGLRGRWTQIQTGFVDEPRDSVQQADRLVAEVSLASLSTLVGTALQAARLALSTEKQRRLS